MGKSNKKTRDLAVLGAVVVLAAAGGFYYISLQSPPVNVEDSAEDEVVDRSDVIKTQQEVLRHKDILEGFEAALNNFLTNIDQQVNAYQNQRKIVRDMIKPENMNQFEYVAENHEMATELMDGMKSDMEKIILFITKSDLNIQNYLERENPSNRSELLQQWTDVKNKQSDLYVRFFELEKELLGQFDQIFTIFLKSEGKYTVDIANNNVAFNDGAITRDYLNAKKQIETIILYERQLLNASQRGMTGGQSGTVSPELTEQAIDDQSEVLPSASVQPAPVQPVVLPGDVESGNVGQPIMPVVPAGTNGDVQNGVMQPQEQPVAQEAVPPQEFVPQESAPQDSVPAAVPMTTMPAENAEPEPGVQPAQ